jgi:very-short-patch-repair endonuclease
MTIVYIVIGIVVLLATVLFIASRTGETEEEKPEYQYVRKNFFLTSSEHQCYDALVAAVGSEYYIFAQVHLSALVDHKIKGQNWGAAFQHINGKSVDFVLCDKAKISPVLAIELDDKSHERPDRQERDVVVEGILRQAKLPLLRLENRGGFKPEELRQRIREHLT